MEAQRGCVSGLSGAGGTPFLSVAGLRSPFPCRLSAGGHLATRGHPRSSPRGSLLGPLTLPSCLHFEPLTSGRACPVSHAVTLGTLPHLSVPGLPRLQNGGHNSTYLWGSRGLASAVLVLLPPSWWPGVRKGVPSQKVSLPPRVVHAKGRAADSVTHVTSLPSPAL